MEIYLYAIADEQNKINKTLGDALALTGTMREGCSVTSPTFDVGGGLGVSRCNYAYIPAFARYYFVEDVTAVRNGLWRMAMSVDVLMSYREQILGLQCVLSADTSPDAETYVGGDAWATTVKESTTIMPFSGGLNDTGEYILITSGG